MGEPSRDMGKPTWSNVSHACLQFSKSKWKSALKASLACAHVIAGQPVELLLGAHLGW